MAKQKRKYPTLTIRLAQVSRDRIDAAAAKQGKSTGEFVRSAITTALAGSGAQAVQQS